jgi:hypothetical protein
VRKKGLESIKTCLGIASDKVFFERQDVVNLESFFLKALSSEI